MGLINNLYIHVTRESINKSIESTSHPVEKGLPITSTIKKQPTEITLEGFIVKTDKYDAKTTRKMIAELQNNGSLIHYKGRLDVSDMQIQSFDSDYESKVWGGFAFTMTLKQVRIAKSSYKKNNNSTEDKKKDDKKNNPTLKVGATVVFKGGSVYVSSDATKASANRGRSTCKITIISTASYSKHQYHLVSSDGGKVYGWVDKSNIEGVPTSSTGTKTNSGTKQVQGGKGTAVYHSVKSGDTIYALVNNNYRSLGKTCQWVIDNNPNAFSKPKDPTTLKVGEKLLMGYKG